MSKLSDTRESSLTTTGAEHRQTVAHRVSDGSPGNVEQAPAGAADWRSGSKHFKSFASSIPHRDDDDFAGLVIPGLNQAQTHRE